MKSLQIPFLPQLDAVSLPDAAAIMLEQSMPHHIDCVNWQSRFPYAPNADFVIARTGTRLFVHFINEGEDLRAENAANLSPVAQDSCVEFFMRVPGSEEYWNFEFNCIGAVNASHRVTRPNAIRLTDEQIDTIKRSASCGTEPFTLRTGLHRWTLTVAILFSLVGINADDMPDHLLGNFYKCAGLTPHPHYLSWAPVDGDKPDFHRPDCFGTLTL